MKRTTNLNQRPFAITPSTKHKSSLLPTSLLRAWHWQRTNLCCSLLRVSSELRCVVPPDRYKALTARDGATKNVSVTNVGVFETVADRVRACFSILHVLWADAHCCRLGEKRGKQRKSGSTRSHFRRLARNSERRLQTALVVKIKQRGSSLKATYMTRHTRTLGLH